MDRPFSRRTLIRGSVAFAATTGALSLASPALAHPHRPGRGSRIAPVAYIEVNSNSILNVGNYVLSDGTPAFDYVVIFAANINYDGEKAYLHMNDNVQRVLDNAETTIRPLQQRGIKVLLSVLGNHEGAGFANFPSRKAADDFAKQVSRTVRRYGLDGVDLDDEWVEYGKNGTGEPNDFSFLAMLSSLRKRLPNRVISFYFIGPSSEHAEYRGLSAGQLVDYAWNPYYNQYNVFDVPGLPKERYGAAAIDLSKASGISLGGIEKLAQRTVDDGLGAFVTYELQPGDQSAKVSAFTRALYGSEATYTGEFVL